MSVIVKGMKMPETCNKCDAYVCYKQWALDPGDEFCGLTKNDIPSEGVPSWCPLVELPEKHGPLIDADEIRWAEHYDNDGNLSSYKIAFSDEMPPTVFEAEDK